MNYERPSTKPECTKGYQFLFGAMAIAAMVPGGPANAAAPADGRIGYVMTERRWAVYGTEDGKAECPHGFNLGPREQFDVLFPKSKGKVYTEMETRLMREGRAFHAAAEEPLPFYEAQGPVSYGLNLDGKVGPKDFQDPSGVKGVDNELYRAIGCIGAYRKDGVIWFFDTQDMIGNGYNRWMIEITGVDDLANDDDVTVTTYRSLDQLYPDGTGVGYVPGSTQEIDERWGQSFIAKLKGKIVDGVLTTAPVDTLKWPNSQPGVFSGYYVFRAPTLRLDLTDSTATGFLGGYVDVESFTHQLNTNWATHHQSYGQLSAASLYHEVRRLADAYPNPETGVNTAISSAIELKLVQAYLVKPSKKAIEAVTASSR